jgi:hypothetical protein
MHRCSSGLLLILTLTLVGALTGCLGKSTNSSGTTGIQSVSLTPSENFSMDVGTTQVFTATARNSNGGTVIATDIQFIVSVPAGTNGSAPLSIASNGNGCAGTWDASVAICNPGTPGVAVVEAVANGVHSPQTFVYIHQHIDSLTIQNAQSQPPLYDCFSQGQTWIYKATAFSQGVDITSSVGPISWSASNIGVVTTIQYVVPNQPTILNQVQVTAKAPGITQLYATVSNTSSNPMPFTTCLVKAIYLQVGGQAQAGNSITVDNGSTVPVTAIVVDTLNGITTSPRLAEPPLTWSTTNPEVALFTTTTNSTGTNNATARPNLGGATITASCTPPSCNIGVFPSLPIYATDCLQTSSTPCNLPDGLPGNGYGSIAVNVTSTAKTPTYTAWAATTGCQDQIGCSSSMFTVTSGTKPIGSILTLSRTPNSILMNHVTGPRLYIGSDQGLMYVDTTAASPSPTLISTSTTPCNVSLCGKVLAVSNDGKLAVVSDTISTPSQVYIYNGGTSGAAPVDLIIPGQTVTAAAFSPDQLKVFLLTNSGNLYVYSTIDALSSVPVATSVSDVKFSADGSFAYIAGTPAANLVSGYATCDTPTTNVLNGVSITNTPVALYPMPMLPLNPHGNTTQPVLVLDPPNVDMFGVTVEQNPLLYDHFVCAPPTVTLDTTYPKTSFNLGQGNFTPIYSQLVADGSQLIVVAKNIPAVLLFNTLSGTTTSVPLVNGASPLSASASTDGSQVFIAACDQYAPDGVTCASGSIHLVNTQSGGDFQQVPYVNINNNNDHNMCDNGGNPAPQCLPDLIAIKPQ